MTVWLVSLAFTLVSVFVIELMAKPIRSASCLFKPDVWIAILATAVLVFSFFMVLTARPVFSAFIAICVLLLIVVVNNVKYKSLNEPFIFQDYDYFIDAIKHPRLFIPFLGYFNFFVICSLAVFLVIAGFYLEPASVDRNYFLILFLCSAFVLFMMSRKQVSSLSYRPIDDLLRYGFFPLLSYYAYSLTQSVKAESPFKGADAQKTLNKPRPHLIAVQSESFFNPDEIWPDVSNRIKSLKKTVWSEASAKGSLTVPAWGANTVRSEYSFLSGVDPETLKAHQFNPYRTIAKKPEAESIAWYLKRLGYRTVCIHPYHKVFYDRDRVMPQLGFDEFYDLSFFSSSARDGAYVADLALVSFIDDVIRQSDRPLFIFVITMENHGPLHLDSIPEERVRDLYSTPPPVGTNEFTKYLHHYEHALEMAADLQKLLIEQEREGALCWYGDHVPIMPSAYEVLGKPKGETPFFIFHSQKKADSSTAVRNLHELGVDFLKSVGLR